jgi:hypothetical protein
MWLPAFFPCWGPSSLSCATPAALWSYTLTSALAQWCSEGATLISPILWGHFVGLETLCGCHALLGVGRAEARMLSPCWSGGSSQPYLPSLQATTLSCVVGFPVLSQNHPLPPHLCLSSSSTPKKVPTLLQPRWPQGTALVRSSGSHCLPGLGGKGRCSWRSLEAVSLRPHPKGPPAMSTTVVLKAGLGTQGGGWSLQIPSPCSCSHSSWPEEQVPDPAPSAVCRYLGGFTPSCHIVMAPI